MKIIIVIIILNGFNFLLDYKLRNDVYMILWKEIWFIDLLELKGEI